MTRRTHAHPDPSFTARLRRVHPGPVRRRPRRLGLSKLDRAIGLVVLFAATAYFTAHALVAAGVGCGT